MTEWSGAVISNPNFATNSGRMANFEQNEPTRAYMITRASVRDVAATNARETQAAHHESQHQHLDTRTSVKAKAGVSSLLEELAISRGMSWVNIAKVAGVSVSAVRKWRKGGTATADNRLSLARLAAVCDLLEDFSVEDPARWMELKMMPLPKDYFFRPIDLYVAGRYTAIFDYASERKTAEAVLNDVDPEWREDRSGFEVVAMADGERFIQQIER